MDIHGLSLFKWALLFKKNAFASWKTIMLLTWSFQKTAKHVHTMAKVMIRLNRAHSCKSIRQRHSYMMTAILWKEDQPLTIDAWVCMEIKNRRIIPKQLSVNKISFSSQLSKQWIGIGQEKPQTKNTLTAFVDLEKKRHPRNHKVGLHEQYMQAISSTMPIQSLLFHKSLLHLSQKSQMFPLKDHMI